MNAIEIIKIVKNLKQASLEHYTFISYVIFNAEIIKKFDGNTKSNHETYIDIIKAPTLFNIFPIKNWNELVNVVSDNILIRDTFNLTDIPTSRMIDIICKAFNLTFNYKEFLPTSLLQFISIANQDYLLFIFSRWIVDSNKTQILKNLNLEHEELNKIDTIIKIITDVNYSNDIHSSLIKNNIQLISFKNYPNWIINPYSQFILESNIYSFAISYHGLGWYIVLSISLLPKNKDKPYFLRLDGGSSEIDRESNLEFFKYNQPPKDKMFNFQDIIKIIENNTIDRHLFTNTK